MAQQGGRRPLAAAGNAGPPPETGGAGTGDGERGPEEIRAHPARDQCRHCLNHGYC